MTTAEICLVASGETPSVGPAQPAKTRKRWPLWIGLGIAGLVVAIVFLGSRGGRATQSSGATVPTPITPKATTAKTPESMPAEPSEAVADTVAQFEVPTGTPQKFFGVSQARLTDTSAIIVYVDGHKGIVNLSTLTPPELDWIKAFAQGHSLAAGKGTVVITHAEAKKTIVKHTQEGTNEILQLCNPGILREQIGNTCALYAAAHWLEIAGYTVTEGDLYKVIASSPPENPWNDPGYGQRLDRLWDVGGKHAPAGEDTDGYAWARQQLRLGRPLYGYLSKEFWLALPAEFIATHTWDGSAKMGHAIVVNGFTWDPANPKTATFHIINSWRDLAEFDVPVDGATKQTLSFGVSLSPKGSVAESKEKVEIVAVTAIRAVGKQTLFRVETKTGSSNVLANDEAGARRLVENL